MAKVRLLNGKPLMVGGKVALSDDCCCQQGACPVPCAENLYLTFSGVIPDSCGCHAQTIEIFTGFDVTPYVVPLVDTDGATYCQWFLSVPPPNGLSALLYGTVDCSGLFTDVDDFLGLIVVFLCDGNPFELPSGLYIYAQGVGFCFAHDSPPPSTLVGTYANQLGTIYPSCGSPIPNNPTFASGLFNGSHAGSVTIALS